MTRPNVAPAVEHVATYIKSRLQNEILYTASIAQEIEADGNKKEDRKEAANANEETRGKAKG